MTLRLRFSLLALGTACALSACASVETGQREAGATMALAQPDEAGMWRTMDDHEAQMQASPLLNRDEELNAYVSDVMCRVAGEFCGDLRVYVIDRPQFNAMMAPNGYSEVWTGLLLRAASEDELAFVLAHEAGHFIENHSIERWRSARRSTAIATGFAVITAGAGVGLIGDIGLLATYANIFSYTREQEREADAYGQRLAAEAGYSPMAGSHLWDSLIAEQAQSDIEDRREARASVFDTHPISTERAATLRNSASDFPERADGTPDRHLEIIAPHIDRWLDYDIAERDYGRSLHLLDQLVERGMPMGVIELHRGDVYRLRADEDQNDADNALASYRAAVGYENAPARAHRELGMLLRARGESLPEAAGALRRYLELDPNASDRAFIARYIENLESSS